jgi:4a-hydroxytetrahydrobiopterin dehydratase
MNTPTSWTRDQNHLIRTFQFANFQEAFAFLVRVAFLAESHNHHPEIYNVYRNVTLRLSTHDAGNTVTEKDVALAEAINSLD